MKRLLIAITLIFFTTSAFALQIKHAIDNERIVANISATDITRIVVEGDRIKSVRGLQGAYTRSEDTEHGEIFIQPSPNYQRQAFTLLLSTEKGRHYTLLLTGMQIPSDTLMLVPQGATKTQAIAFERASDYEQVLFQLIKNMVHNQTPDGYSVEQLAGEKPVTIPKGGSAELITRYQGVHLVGLAYQLINTSHQTISLNEADFYQPGVRAVALEQMTLKPQQSCLLWEILSHD